MQNSGEELERVPANDDRKSCKKDSLYDLSYLLRVMRLWPYQ